MTDYVFTVEPFDRFILEEDLFHSHAEDVGKGWDDVIKLNWPLAGAMAARGELVVLSARVERRMVGYAVLMFGADLLSERLVASLVFLYARKEHPGLGLQLARAAGEASRALGAGALWLFATNDSPDSQRLGVLAKRLGASRVSETFELSLTSEPT